MAQNLMLATLLLIMVTVATAGVDGLCKSACRKACKTKNYPASCVPDCVSKVDACVQKTRHKKSCKRVIKNAIDCPKNDGAGTEAPDKPKPGMQIHMSGKSPEGSKLESVITTNDGGVPSMASKSENPFASLLENNDEDEEFGQRDSVEGPETEPGAEPMASGQDEYSDLFNMLNEKRSLQKRDLKTMGTLGSVLGMVEHMADKITGMAGSGGMGGANREQRREEMRRKKEEKKRRREEKKAERRRKKEEKKGSKGSKGGGGGFDVNSILGDVF